VTVIEIAKRSMGRGVPPEIGAIMEERHRRAGVDLRFGVGVDRIEAEGKATRLSLSDGTRVVCDVVIAGIGVIPNTELAAQSGLTIANGISVDTHLGTDDPAIFAAGDCCSFPHPLYGDLRIRLEAWRNAHDTANVAAANMLGGDKVCDAVPWFWSDQYELGLQICGLPDAAVTEVVRRRADGCDVRFGLDAHGRLVCASGIAPGGGIAKDIRLAEMMIARRETPSVGALADPDYPLKKLLDAAKGST